MNAHVTLRAWYESTHRRLFLLDARPRTLDEYRWMLRAWEKCFGGLTGPPLDEITIEHLAAWRAWLLERHEIPTVNKHLRELAAVLNKAGPPGPRNRDALGALAAAPWVRPLRWQRELPRAVDVDELGKLYAAADVALHPTKSAATWWRAWIVAAAGLGYRRGALLSIDDDQVDWREADVRCSAESDKRSTARIKPASSIVMRHLLTVRGRGRLFAWAHGARAFYASWHAIVAAADVAPCSVHDLKRTCGTMLSRVASPWAVRYMLDHAQRDVTGTCYVDVRDELREAVESVAWPAAIAEAGGLRIRRG